MLAPVIKLSINQKEVSKMLKLKFVPLQQQMASVRWVLQIQKKQDQNR